jgi:hypothetical protein
MPGIASLEAFQRGVHEFDILNFQLDIEPAALAAARRSLEESGLLLLGEVHGVRQNALIARELMAALDISGLALEWPAGLASSVSGFFNDGQVPNHPLLWGGDGRIPAGHFALLWERFSAARLTALTLFDGVSEVGWSRREAAMAERILTAQADTPRTLVIAGSAHTALAPTGLGIPLGARLAEQRRGVLEVRIRYGNGGYYNLSPQRFKRQWSLRRRARLRIDGATLVLDLPSAMQARVPHRLQPHQSPLRPAAAGYTGAFAAYQDAPGFTGAFPAYTESPHFDAMPGQPPRQHQPDPFAFPVQGQPRQTQPHPGQPYPAQGHQPRSGYPTEPGGPPFMGHPRQDRPAGPGQPRQPRRVLPYEVELPTR